MPQISQQKFPVLMYHGVQDSEADSGNFDPVYSITHQQFEEQLDWLKDNGYQACTLAQIKTAQANKTDNKIVVITFDDGDITNYTSALSRLVDRKMHAEFYITTDWIGNEFSMAPDQLRELDSAGMAVDSHGKTHQYLSDLKSNEVSVELRESKRVLEEILGKTIDTIALPGGRGDQRVRELAEQAGYKRLCTSVLGYNDQNTDPFAIKRIAITRQMDLNTFASLVSNEGNQMLRLQSRQFILTSMKMILGNRLYEVVRSRLLG